MLGLPLKQAPAVPPAGESPASRKPEDQIPAQRPRLKTAGGPTGPGALRAGGPEVIELRARLPFSGCQTAEHPWLSDNVIKDCPGQSMGT